jgi:hypothetical protein
MAKRRPGWLDELTGEHSMGSVRTRERTHLAPVYVLLLAIVVLATIVSVVWQENEFVNRFGPNFASESLGILLTVVFVRRFMEQAERSRRLRASVGALRKARRSLQDMVDIWTQTLKGCTEKRDPGAVTTIYQLLSADNSELLLWCDPLIRARGRDGERWVEWAGRQLRAAQDSLDQITATYGGTLDPEYIESLDALIADPFLKGFADLSRDAGMEAARWRVALNSVRALRMSHFERLLATIRLHNELTAEVAEVRGGTSAPRTSMLGVQLAPDHDLRIDIELDDSWWRSAPNVGSLRMGDLIKRSTAPDPPDIDRAAQ